MTPQIFAFGDLPVIGVLVLLEGLLSADNALVLALMVRHLPSKLQRRALLYGLGGAFVFRLVAIMVAAWIIRLWWLQAIGSAYLLFLLIKHFVAHSQKEGGKKEPARKAGFWQTVILVELTDIAFAIDSVVAAIGIEHRQEKLWVIYFGAVIGIVLLRFAASAFIKLLEKFPSLEHMAYVLVGWVGVKLAFLAGHNYVLAYNKDNKVPLTFTIPLMDKVVFWAVLGAIIVGFLVHGVRERKRQDAEPPPPE